MNVYQTISSGGYTKGMIVMSVAGHDAGQTYMVISVEERLLTLANGTSKQLCRPKKKHIKHVRLLSLGICQDEKKLTCLTNKLCEIELARFKETTQRGGI